MDIENGVTIMINGIKPKLTPETEFGTSFDGAVNNLLENIQACYDNWRDGVKYGSMKKMNLSLKPGSKFIKVVNDNSVWGFIAKVDGTHKGLPLKAGDVLKAAGWRAPAKHTRGNIFDDNQDYFDWTGPNYL